MEYGYDDTEIEQFNSSSFNKFKMEDSQPSMSNSMNSKILPYTFNLRRTIHQGL